MRPRVVAPARDRNDHVAHGEPEDPAGFSVGDGAGCGPSSAAALVTPLNSAPGRAASPFRHCIATVSSAISASVGKSVMSAQTKSGPALMWTVAVADGLCPVLR